VIGPEAFTLRVTTFKPVKIVKMMFTKVKVVKIKFIQLKVIEMMFTQVKVVKIMLTQMKIVKMMFTQVKVVQIMFTQVNVAFYVKYAVKDFSLRHIYESIHSFISINVPMSVIYVQRNIQILTNYSCTSRLPAN